MKSKMKVESTEERSQIVEDEIRTQEVAMSPKWAIHQILCAVPETCGFVGSPIESGELAGVCEGVALINEGTISFCTVFFSSLPHWGL